MCSFAERRSFYQPSFPRKEESTGSVDGQKWIPAFAGMTPLPPLAGDANALRRCVGSTRDSSRAIPTLRVGPLATGSRGGFPIAAILRVLLLDIRVTC